MTDPRKTDSPLQFKPLHPGLGFHPFSDGLPYAPVSQAPVQTTQKSRLQSGAGAIAAGPATFISPPPRHPSVGMSTPGSVHNNATLHVPRIPVAAPASLQMNRQQNNATAPAQIISEEAEFGLLYFIKRCMAYAVDTCISTALCAGAMAILFTLQHVNIDVLFSPAGILLCSLFLLSFHWAFVAAQEVAFNTSLGKLLFGLRLQGSSLMILLRALLFIPSIALGALGLAWAMFHPKRRCWHDVAVNIQPVEAGNL